LRGNPESSLSGSEFVARAAAGASQVKYSAYHQLCEVTLCRGGARVIEVRVPFVCHAADEAFRAGIE